MDIIVIYEDEIHIYGLAEDDTLTLPIYREAMSGFMYLPVILRQLS
ncbi:MAG: hypothetical protein LUQ38_00870 [Methanotrichaceae archaeon]|nr:hypothetical protein [Methanotrichaceae archaeon]